MRNHLADSDFYQWEKNSRLAKALAATQPRTIDVPRLDEVTAETVQQRGLPFSSFVTDSTNSRILRGYVSDWTASVRAEFDRVGIAKAVQPSPQGEVLRESGNRC